MLISYYEMKSISRLPIAGGKSKEQLVHLHVPRPTLPRDPFPGIFREPRFPTDIFALRVSDTTIDGRNPAPVDMTNISLFVICSAHIHLYK